MAVRLLLYLAETYKEYIAANDLDVYAVKPLTFPRAELYVVYTGEREDVPERVSLSELFGEALPEAATSCGVELQARVLRSDGTGSIIDQYVRFCRIMDAQRIKHGYTQKAIDEAFRLCREQGILTDFLNERAKEVQDIMFTLFSQEELTARHERALIRDAKDAGMADGKIEGKKEGIASAVLAMMTNMGWTADYAMDVANVPAEQRPLIRRQLRL